MTCFLALLYMCFMMCNLPVSVSVTYKLGYMQTCCRAVHRRGEEEEAVLPHSHSPLLLVIHL